MSSLRTTPSLKCATALKMEKTPLRLKFKLGSGGSSTPEPGSPAHPTIISSMAEEEQEMPLSDEEVEEEEWFDEGQGEDVLDGSQGVRVHHSSHDDIGRERHKKSKKKKKKKERDKEKERHKHKHHKEKAEVDESEPPSKRLNSLDPGNAPMEVPCRVSVAAFKELLTILLEQLERKDTQQFFSFPVTDAIAPGYSSIITQPMDFSRMRQKIADSCYTTISQFEADIKLICNNCMIYNQPDTVYYKAARKLFHTTERMLSPDRLISLRKEVPNIVYVTKAQVGIDIRELLAHCDQDEGSMTESSKTTEDHSQEGCRFELFDEALTAEEILQQTQKASQDAAERLTLKKPASTLGFLRQRGDGTTSLNFLTGCEGNDPNLKEKPVSLGLLTGKLLQGTNSLHNYRDDKRSMAKPVKPLFYGAFSSFCPSYDSTFANLTKEESEMVYATYGNETAVQYAESICDFSRDCDMAMHLVDQLLNLLTHQQHSKTKAVIEERRRVQQEEQKIAAFLSSDQLMKSSKPKNINFTSLHTLEDVGIDTSFLNVFEHLEQKQRSVDSQLEQNAILLDTLAKEQKERLSRPLPSNLNNLPKPSATEIALAEKVTEGLVAVACQVPPGALAPVPIVRRAMGITMTPVMQEGSSHGEVGDSGGP